MNHPAGIDAPTSAPFGYWTADGPPLESPADFRDAVADLRSPVAVVRTATGLGVVRGGAFGAGVAAPGAGRRTGRGRIECIVA